MAGSSGAPTEGMFGIHSYGGGQTVDGGAPPLRAGCFCIYTSKNGRRERVRLERVGDNDGDPGALERAESLCTVSRWQNGQRLEAEVPRQRLRVLATPVGALRERIRNRLPGVRRAFAAGEAAETCLLPSTIRRGSLPAPACADSPAQHSKSKTIARCRAEDTHNLNQDDAGDHTMGAPDDTTLDTVSSSVVSWYIVHAGASGEEEEEVVQRLEFDPRQSAARENASSCKRRLPSPEAPQSASAKRIRNDDCAGSSTEMADCNRGHHVSDDIRDVAHDNETSAQGAMTAQEDGGNVSSAACASNQPRSDGNEHEIFEEETGEASARRGLHGSETAKRRDPASEEGSGAAAETGMGAPANSAVMKNKVVGAPPWKKKLSLRRGSKPDATVKSDTLPLDSFPPDSLSASSASDEEQRVIDLTDENEKPSDTAGKKIATSSVKSKSTSACGIATAKPDNKVMAQDGLSDKHKKLIEDILSRKKTEANLSMWGRQSSQGLTLHQLCLMFDALRSMSQTKLDLCKQEQLGDEGLKYLVNVLLKSPACRLRKLDLNSTGLSNAAIPVMFEGLKHAKTVDYVDLRGNDGINQEGCQAITDRLLSIKRPLEIEVPNGAKRKDCPKSGGHPEFVGGKQNTHHDDNSSDDSLQGDLAARMRDYPGLRGSSDDDDDDHEDELALSQASRRPGQEQRSTQHKPCASRAAPRQMGQKRIDDFYSDHDHQSGDMEESDEEDDAFRDASGRKARERHGISKAGASQGVGGRGRKVLALAGFSETINRRTQGASMGGAHAARHQGIPAQSSKKQKGLKGSSVSRGGGSSHRGSAACFQQNSAPQSYGFGPLLPPRKSSLTASSGRSGADWQGGDVTIAGETEIAQQVDGSASSRDAVGLVGSSSSKTGGMSSAFDMHRRKEDALASKRASGMLGAGASLPMVNSGHTFPRLLPIQELGYSLEAQRSCVKSQWSAPGPLAQRHLEAIRRIDDNVSKSIDEGLRRCEGTLRNLNESCREGVQRQGNDDWDEAACVNFFEWVLFELGKLGNSGSDLSRAWSYVLLLRNCDSILSRNDSPVQALENADGGLLAWLRLYTQLNLYLLKWLQVMEGAAWKRALDTAVEGPISADARRLAETYNFTLHSTRLLRIALAIADSPVHAPVLFDGLQSRQRNGPEHKASVRHASMECILELWAGIIRLQDATDKEEDKYWRRLSVIFESYRCLGTDGYYYTLPHLQPKPQMIESMPHLEFKKLASSGRNSTCAKEEALEFWWVVAALSSALYCFYDVPRLGGWDFLSQLLANSPLVHGGESHSFSNGSIFNLTASDPIHQLADAKTDFLIELIDRCSLLATMWPMSDAVGKRTFANLNLLRDLSQVSMGKQARPSKGLVSELWRLVTDRPETHRNHATDEELANVGRLPSNYPFCPIYDLKCWFRKNIGGSRSLCCAVGWLVQNLVLRTQHLDHSQTTCNPVSCKEDFAKDFNKLDSSLQVVLRKEAVLLLDPACGAKGLNSSEAFSPAPCRRPSELRRCRSNWLLLSVLMQLAPAQHKSVPGHAVFFERIANSISIPRAVNAAWHYDDHFIQYDKQVRLSFIAVCACALDYLVRRKERFTYVADMLQKMLKLAVMETVCDRYDNGMNVSTIPERKEAAQKMNLDALTPAEDASKQRNFKKMRLSCAQEVIRKVQDCMGLCLDSWLRECEKSIASSVSRELDGGRLADQAYEHVSTEDGQLSLFGVEVLPIFIVACMRVCKQMSQLRFFQLRALCDLPSSHCRLLTLRDAVGSALGAQGLSWLQRRSYRGHLEIHRRQNSELESNQRKHVFDRHIPSCAIMLCFTQHTSHVHDGVTSTSPRDPHRLRALFRRNGGKDPRLPAAALIECASAHEGGQDREDAEDDDFESYDLDLLEKGAVVGEDEARSISMRLTKLIFSSESVSALIKAHIIHLMRWLKRIPQLLSSIPSEGVKESSARAGKEQMKTQALRTYATLALANLRCGLLKWSELEPQIKQLKMPLETGNSCSYITFFSSLLEAATTKLDSSWLDQDMVKYEITGMWFQGMLDRRCCRSPNAQRGLQIVEFSKTVAQMPLMQGVHGAMHHEQDHVAAFDERCSYFPHLYERPWSPACLVLHASSQDSIAGNEVHFKQRIQGLRQFSEGLRTLPEHVEPRTVSKMLGAWKDCVRKACQDLEPRRRLAYQVYCLESFAVLFPYCAKFLHKEYTRNSKCMESTALFDLFHLHFIDMFDSPELMSCSGDQDKVRLLDARIRCVPAVLLGIMQIDCDRRLAEVFRSLVALLLQNRGDKPDLETARSRTIQEVFAILFLRDYATERTSSAQAQHGSILDNARLRDPSERRARAGALGKLLVRLLFCAFTQRCQATTNSLVKACAAMNVIKSLLKDLAPRKNGDHASNSDSKQLRMQMLQEILHLAAEHLSMLSNDNRRVVFGFWLMSIANTALSTLIRDFPGHKIDGHSSSVDGRASLAESLPRPAMVRKSLQVIMYSGVLAFCEAFPLAQQLPGDQHADGASVSQNLSNAANELQEHAASSGHLNPPSSLSQKILIATLQLGTVVDDSNTSDSIEVKHLSDCSVADAEMGRAALKVLKKMLVYGDDELRRSLLACVPDMAFRVSNSQTKKLAHTDDNSSSRDLVTLAQRRLFEWDEFYQAAQEPIDGNESSTGLSGAVAHQMSLEDALLENIGEAEPQKPASPSRSLDVGPVAAGQSLASASLSIEYRGPSDPLGRPFVLDGLSRGAGASSHVQTKGVGTDRDAVQDVDSTSLIDPVVPERAQIEKGALDGVDHISDSESDG